MTINCKVVEAERIIRIDLDVKDCHGSQAPLACEVVDRFDEITARYPRFANASFIVAIKTVNGRYYSLLKYCESHLEALNNALDWAPLTAGDRGECVVVGPCGFDDCRCDGDRYAIRWEFSVHAVVSQPAGEA